MIEVFLVLDGLGMQLWLCFLWVFDVWQFVLLFIVLLGVMWLVFVFGWWVGNVFVFLFVLLYSLVLVVVLCVLWCSGEWQEEIWVVLVYVEVIFVFGGLLVFWVYLYWVCLFIDDERVWLVFSGWQVEVGSFFVLVECQMFVEIFESLFVVSDGGN